MKTHKPKIKIEDGVLFEASSLANLSGGGTHPSYKTKSANKKWIKKFYGSNDKANFQGEYNLGLN